MITSTPNSLQPRPQFALDGLDSPRSPQIKNSVELEAHLEAWIATAPTRLPFENRNGAAEAIRNCWLEKADSLNLPGFDLSELPEAVFGMDHLRALNLSHNRLTGLPDDLRHLTGLKTLNLSHNPLHSLPEAITGLRDLNGLNLVDTALTSCPRQLFDLPRQCIIYLRGVELDPAEAAWLSDNEARHQHGPHIDHNGPPRRDPDRASSSGAAARRNNAPPPETQVVGFRTPFLQENSRPALPAEPRLLVMPPHLQASAPVPIGPAHHVAAPVEAGSVSPPAAAKALAAEAGQALAVEQAQRPDTRLTTICIDHGLCLELRAWIYDAQGNEAQAERRKTAQIVQRCIDNGSEQLVLSKQRLSDLPPIVWDQTQLRMLYLGDNELQASALAQIGRLTRLTHLTLGNNQLSALPPEIGRLTSLQVLDLSTNFFDALPPEMSQLTELQHLYLNDNRMWAKHTLDYVPQTCAVSPHMPAG